MTAPIDTLYHKTVDEPAIKRIIAFSFLTLILTTSTEVFTRFNIASMLWALIYAGSVVYIILDQKLFFKAIKHSWPAFLLPLYALTSTFWSETPTHSLYAAMQLIFTTLFATWIGSRFSAITIFKSLLLATSLGVLLSIINDNIYSIGFLQPITFNVAETIATAGVFNQKNVYGSAVALLTLSIIVLGMQYKKLPVAIALCALLWIPLSSTQSARAILIYMLTMMIPIYWWLSSKIQQQFVLLLTLLAIFLISVFMLIIFDIDLVNNILHGMGKDSTLTGRTYLWSIGIDIFENHPFLGVGYQAFWQPGAFDQVAIIHTHFYGQELNGFHSAFIEVLVALGAIGLCLFAYLPLATLARSVNWYQKQANAISLGVIFFVFSTIMTAVFEVLLLRQHEMFYILMVTFYVLSKKQAINQNIHNKQHLK